MSSRPDRMPIQQNAAQPKLERADFVIIGNGIAGLTAALEARRLAPEKRIVIVTEQIHPTINTPALKQYAIGKLEREQLLAYPAGTERAERIHVVASHVEKIHAQSKYVSLSGGRGFGYETLLIATGSSPLGLPDNIPGSNFDGVLRLHRLQDYLDFRRRLSEVSEAVVIGSGAHAIETVMGLLYWGIKVHWLIRGKTFMTRMLDKTASDMVLESVRKAGAIIATETEVVGIVGRVGSVAGVITNQQEMIPCQMVITCTGIQAVTTLAENCTVPMRYKCGILVDDKQRTSVRDIYAAGDVAALRNPQTGEYETRALWYAAGVQGRIAGAMAAGYDDAAKQSFGVMWHATHLGELYMLTVGDPLIENEKVDILTDTSQGEYRRLALLGDRLVGYLSMGTVQPDSLSIKHIIDEGYSVRKITRALLKGNFDARSYISQRRSYAAQSMLISGKMPSPSLAGMYSTTELERLQAATGQPTPLSKAGPARVTAHQDENFAGDRRTGELQRVVASQDIKREVLYEEEVSPFSGNLPGISNPGILAGEVSAFSGNLPAVSNPGILAGEVSAFSGNLPAVSYNSIEPSIASSSGPGSGQPGRNLWAYSTSSESEEEGESYPNGAPQKQTSSRNLWSYSNKGNSAR